MSISRLGYKNGIECNFYLKQGNRHGLITGGTGSGKTITLQKLVEIFSYAGCAVFLPDVKGDLTAMMDEGKLPSSVVSMLKDRGIDEPIYKGLPVEYWRVSDKDNGHFLSVRLSDFGVDMLAPLMRLNNNQLGVLTSLFTIAENLNDVYEKLRYPKPQLNDNELNDAINISNDFELAFSHINSNEYELNNLSDLTDFIRLITPFIKPLSMFYGAMSNASLSVIIRACLRLQRLGLDQFFSDNDLYVTDFIRQAKDGRGVVNILQSVELVKNPEIYGTIVMYLLKRLYDVLPEVGNLPVPKLAFFFDEAHLIFNLQNKEINSIMENTVRLIRSKGVGVYFVSQAPRDIPDEILGQLGNKIQHSLRASTPKDQTALAAAAKSMPIAYPSSKTFKALEETIKGLQVGEAVVSLLNDKGQSSLSEIVYILPPASKSGVAEKSQIVDNTENSMLYLFYSKDTIITEGVQIDNNIVYLQNESFLLKLKNLIVKCLDWCYTTIYPIIIKRLLK